MLIQGLWPRPGLARAKSGFVRCSWGAKLLMRRNPSLPSARGCLGWFHLSSGETLLNNAGMHVWSQRGHIQGIRTIPSRKSHTLRTKLRLLKGRKHDSGFLHNTHQTCEESENVTQRSGSYDDPEVRFSRQGLKQLLEICLRTWRKGWSWWTVWGCQQKKKGSFKHDLNGNIKAKSFKIKNFQTCSRKHRRISLHSSGRRRCLKEDKKIPNLKEGKKKTTGKTELHKNWKVLLINRHH